MPTTCAPAGEAMSTRANTARESRRRANIGDSLGWGCALLAVIRLHAAPGDREARRWNVPHVAPVLCGVVVGGGLEDLENVAVRGQNRNRMGARLHGNDFGRWAA